MNKAKRFLGYFGVFFLGILCGGGVVWHRDWGIMYYLMGAQSQAKYRATDTSLDAYWQTKILSHLRLGENQAAIDKAEEILDQKTIEATQWAKEAQDKQVNTMQRGQLGIIKRYRSMYPAHGELKATVDQILNQVPDLPEPRPEVPDSKLNTVFRLYRFKKAHQQ